MFFKKNSEPKEILDEEPDDEEEYEYEEAEEPSGRFHLPNALSSRKRFMDTEYAGYEWEEQLDAKGRKHRVLVYHDTYYSFNYKGSELRKKKVFCALLVLLSIAIYIPVCGIMSTQSTGVPLVSVGYIIAFIPYMYLLIGLFSLCKAKEPFEKKVPITSIARMKHSAGGILALLGYSWIANIIYLICHHEAVVALNEAILIIGLGASIGLLIILMITILKFQTEEASPSRK